eukprot:GEZU01039883.1.p1 GENE.GEZU01039883.1~~GEZU01039883.1.p1  ORF type:complete len:227 (-),score=19.82 GEZU01039883.1:44-724(-)
MEPDQHQDRSMRRTTSTNRDAPMDRELIEAFQEDLSDFVFVTVPESLQDGSGAAAIRPNRRTLPTARATTATTTTATTTRRTRATGSRHAGIAGASSFDSTSDLTLDELLGGSDLFGFTPSHSFNPVYGDRAAGTNNSTNNDDNLSSSSDDENLRGGGSGGVLGSRRPRLLQRRRPRSRPNRDRDHRDGTSIDGILEKHSNNNGIHVLKFKLISTDGGEYHNEDAR